MGTNLTRNLRVMVVQAEGTPGTMETDLATADFIHRIRDIEIQPGIEFDDEGSKYANGNHAEDEAVVGKQIATITCKMKMTYGGAVTTQPDWWVLCKMCGLGAIGWTAGAESALPGVAGVSLVNRAAYDDVTHTIWIIDKEIGSGTVYTIYKFSGCMGNVVFSVDGVGKPWIANFTIFGVLNDIVDGSNIVINAASQTVLAQPFLSSAVTIGNTAVKCSKISLDLGNTISPLEDQSKAQGVLLFHRTATKPRISIDPLAVKQATTDVLANVIAMATQAIVIPFAVNNAQIKGIDCQVMNPSLAAREGLVNWGLNYRCLQNGTPAAKADTALTLEDTIDIMNGSRGA